MTNKKLKDAIKEELFKDFLNRADEYDHAEYVFLKHYYTDKIFEHFYLYFIQLLTILKLENTEYSDDYEKAIMSVKLNRKDFQTPILDINKKWSKYNSVALLASGIWYELSSKVYLEFILLKYPLKTIEEIDRIPFDEGWDYEEYEKKIKEFFVEIFEELYLNILSILEKVLVPKLDQWVAETFQNYYNMANLIAGDYQKLFEAYELMKVRWADRHNVKYPTEVLKAASDRYDEKPERKYILRKALFDELQSRPEYQRIEFLSEEFSLWYDRLKVYRTNIKQS